MNTISMYEVNIIQIGEVLEILKTSGMKTSFHDFVPAHVLKQVIDVLLPYFCELVNKSLIINIYLANF